MNTQDIQKATEDLKQKLLAMSPDNDNLQIYDSAFKTMVIRIPRFCIPLINTMFGTDYNLNDEIDLLYGEDTSIANTFRIHNRRTDSKLQLTDTRYHIECASRPGGDVAIQLFEYDWIDAVHHIEKEKDEYVICLQHSGLLYLRSNSRTPNAYTYRILFPDGREAAYRIPIIRNSDYSLEEIFREKLYLLLPFYLLRYERTGTDSSPKNRFHESVNKTIECLESDMKIIYNGLKQGEQDGMISSYERVLLWQLIWIIAGRIFQHSQKIKERVESIMGGQVLEFEWETEYRMQINAAKDIGRSEGRNEGRNEGRAEGATLKLISLVCRKLKKGKSPELIAEELEEDLEKVEQICQTAAYFAPDYDAEKIYNALQEI